MSTPVTPTLALRRVLHNRWILALAASPFALIALLLFGSLFVRGLGGLAPMLAALGASTTYLAWVKNVRPELRPTDVTFGADGMRLDGRLVPRKVIRSGFVAPTP